MLYVIAHLLYNESDCQAEATLTRDTCMRQRR